MPTHHRHHHHHHAPATATLILANALALATAQATPPAADPPPEVLPEMTITASPLIQDNLVSAWAGAYSVVGARQIEDLGATDIASALRTTPGVNISRNNKVGSYGGSGGGAIFIRGMGASRPGGELVTLYDGAPRYNAVFSHPLLDILSIDAAGAIDVYKSVQPQLFGNAFAAVNITPRQKLTEGFSADLDIAGGPHATLVEKTSAGGKSGPLDFYAGQSHRRSDGDRSNSGGELQDYYLRLGYALNENWTLSLFADRTDNHAEDPGAKNSPYHMGDYKTDDTHAVLTLANHHRRAEGRIKAYWNTGHAAWHDQGMRATGAPVAPGDTDTTIMDWDLYGIRASETFTAWEGGELLAGLDVDVMSGKGEFDRYNPAQNTRFRREDLRILSPHAAIAHQFGARDGYHARPSAGIRLYDHNIFGDNPELAPHIGVVAGYKTTEAHAGYARGVSYPGLNVAAFSQAVLPPLYTDPAKRDAWRNLDAETLDHFEAGLSHRFNPTLKADITAFYDRGDNRYVLTFPATGAPVPQGFANLGDWHNHGIESSATWTPTADLSIFAGATWLRPSVDGMPYAPEWTASAGFNWTFFKNFRLSVDVLYQERMYVNPANAWARSDAAGAAPAANPQVPSSLIVNARLGYRFAAPALHVKQGEVYLAVDNLTDRTWYYRPGYPMSGIGAMLGMRLGF
ncbi:MAG: TonB-dependent receptor plug domain-containing protein [Opitutaceae bacterium]|jgi:iron complex outermembrane receptor protein|nr:TonB-dependent receptor plug domain-containing protein [Opitutaceae bacterium]